MVSIVKSKLSTADIREIIAANPHEVGSVLAHRVGCSKSTIDKLRGEMRDEGLIPPKPKLGPMPGSRVNYMTAEALAQAQIMRRDGAHFADIGRELGFGSTTIQNHLAGRLTPPGSARVFSLEDLSAAIGLRDDGHTNVEIGAIMGFHEHTIQLHLGTAPRMPTKPSYAPPAPLCRFATSLMARGLTERDARYQAEKDRERREQVLRERLG